jgi:phospholipid/cholesterol/gamma-HCH transport system permease protein
MRSLLARLGIRARRSVGGAVEATAVMWAVLVQASRPRTWRRTVRDVLARQVLFTGVEAARFIALIAVFAGLAIVLQAQVWLNRVGRTGLIGPLLVAVIVRELGPLLVNFILIGRSGTAVASELASMRVNGEIRVLESSGIDPFLYLVVPRVLGLALSAFCLTVLFVFVSFVTGFAVSGLLGGASNSAVEFVDGVLQAVRPVDVATLFAKTLLPGMATGAICCLHGLRVEGALTEVPQAASRALGSSIAAMFLLLVLVSVLSYL